jgi:ABC-type multidrug transport system ATPase subunit
MICLLCRVKMTVYEYLEFTAEIRGIEKSVIASSIRKMIKLTSLECVITKRISELSKGFKKRVGLASVLIHDPKILILDEPTAGLDPNQIITFRKMLRRLSEKKTIILSTHILSEIEAICERVIIIKRGSLIAIYKKEIHTYFYSPIAYIFLFIFIMIPNFLLFYMFGGIFQENTASNASKNYKSSQ